MKKIIIPYESSKLDKKLLDRINTEGYNPTPGEIIQIITASPNLKSRYVPHYPQFITAKINRALIILKEREKYPKYYEYKEKRRKAKNRIRFSTYNFNTYSLKDKGHIILEILKDSLELTYFSLLTISYKLLGR